MNIQSIVSATLCFSKLNSSVRTGIKITALALTVCLCASSVWAQAVISNADTSPNGSQKYVLMVGGVQWLPNAIQMRFDKLRYYSAYLWDYAQCNALAAQAASDGFNTIIVSTMLYEVGPTEGTFDWTVKESVSSSYQDNSKATWA